MALIALVFTSKTERNIDESFYSVKANNLLNAIQKVSVCEENIEEGIGSCLEGRDFCGSDDVCGLVEQEINKIIDVTVQEQVRFSVKGQYGAPVIEIGDCEEGVSSVSSVLRTEVGSYNLGLLVCEK